MKRSVFYLVPALALSAALAAASRPAAAYQCTGSSTDYVTNCSGIANGTPCINTVSVGAGCCAPGTCRSDVCNLPPTQTACNDLNSCTTDTCRIVGGGNFNAVCTYTPSGDGTSCDIDGNLCTLDTCQSGTCTAGPAKDCSAQPHDAQCQAPACNTATGNCFAANINEGQHCNDGKDCTYAEVCNNGACGSGAGNGLLRPAGTPCWDGDFCNPGTCNGTDKGCKNKHTLPAGSPCDPNNCTNAFCDNHANCVVASCTGPSANCDQCGPSAPCAASTTNPSFPCGCVSAPIYDPPN
jgi:hypothetical protein